MKIEVLVKRKNHSKAVSSPSDSINYTEVMRSVKGQRCIEESLGSDEKLVLSRLDLAKKMCMNHSPLMVYESPNLSSQGPLTIIGETRLRGVRSIRDFLKALLKEAV
ncbi:MAG: hypothetical protein ACFFE8_10260 [Candidatus Heimdallarchaeota archaeon]